MKSVGEITPDNLDQNIQKLREEFNQKSYYSEKHPKTSHEYKRAMINKKITRTNKALSANKIKWSNLNKLSDKEMLEFYRRHPGYLYYKEIMANMKIKQYPLKKRAFTGKDFTNRKMRVDHNNNINYRKMANTNYNHGNNYNNINRNEKFPKISKTNYFNNQSKQKWKVNVVKNYNYNYNFNYNNFNYSHNHNYNYNINNININIKDKKNPYSLSWVNKILNQNDYKLEIKQKNIIKKEKEKNKVQINNYIKKKDNKEKIESKEKKEEAFIDDKEEELDEEQQMQFYKNQKNFYKARKDIKEEPEDLEEDKDEDNNKNREKYNNN